MKAMSGIGFDNALNVKNQSGRNSRLIDFIESTVEKMRLVSFGEVKVGKMAYNYNGCKAGIVEEILDDNTIVVHGRFHRRNEWKLTPWSPEEITRFSEHHIQESNRVHNQTKQALSAFDRKEKLAKEFVKH
jgi:hypothetical protein